ncbi:MAG: hemin ABC transporter substrate-binding protein [Gammaproteobacteria bacterium]|nr:MAG: hemin ABC transporter substrate-binding protein [Gammaproteobacteria bacterium]
MKKLLFLEVSILSLILYLGMAWMTSANAAETPQAEPVANQAERIVSIDGSITEIIYALGKQDLLVGVDTTSKYPSAATKIKKVGYMRQLSAEGILSLAPTLVIATEAAGPKEVLEQLKKAGLNVHIIHSDMSVEGVYSKIKTVAKILNAEPKGEAIITRIGNNIQRLQKELAKHAWQTPPKVMFLLAAGHQGVMLAGKDTQADAMIKLMGGVNVVDSFTSFKPLTPEGALQTLPDIILVADTRGGSSVLNNFKLLQHTPAAKSNRIIQADSMLLLGFGPRIDKAMSTLAPAFYVTR